MYFKFEGTKEELLEFADAIRATEREKCVTEEKKIKYLSFEEATKPEIMDFAKFIWNSAQLSMWESIPHDVGFSAAVASYFDSELNRLFMCGDLYE